MTSKRAKPVERSAARLGAVQALYQMDLAETDVAEVIEEFNIFGMLPTNPTSGGMPGRQRHIVSASENVQTISTAAYGNPKLWRGVAEANGIDDPLSEHPLAFDPVAKKDGAS